MYTCSAESILNLPLKFTLQFGLKMHHIRLDIDPYGDAPKYMLRTTNQPQSLAILPDFGLVFIQHKLMT